MKKYAIVGLGGRARFFYEALIQDYAETTEIVGLCDINLTRMHVTNKRMVELGGKKVPTYKHNAFDQMIKETQPDCIIVTTVDRTHHHYIIRAMELGCDVITEKPMTVDEDKCQDIINVQKKTGKSLRVSFNYRYAPLNSKIRELIMNDTIGKVNAIHFEWLLNTRHGADYFRRWHRDKRNSGGLLVHKSTHHFDLVNFWLHSQPDTVFAFGDLMFYGRENAENRGVEHFYYRAHDSEYAKNDPFALHMKDSSNLKELYLDAEQEDGYLRDQSVFGDGISIEDTMSVLVRYKNKALLTYSLTAYSPWEGYRVNFTGDKGRLEVTSIEDVYVNGQGDASKEGVLKGMSITVYPQFGEAYTLEMPIQLGGHGGGDPALLKDLFSEKAGEDPLKRAATHEDGAMSILTGIAANKSIASGMPIKVNQLIQF
ncbi:Gfo/Idh/MocA family oxidoreductase [Vallitalea pronyensis]|uniref:Gfo/Idh/MocA family oxidoreductase n=2 Tax=Vallitalea pronyensis TaxID=1348613 RepID=A0A8J8MQS8_9FIRM|nr:Gfo/Idh/MocA family oxidoreductase [Vallitalea pronyensis]